MRHLGFSVTLLVGVVFCEALGTRTHEVGPAYLLNAGFRVSAKA
jgi:hypothetical protein